MISDRLTFPILHLHLYRHLESTLLHTIGAMFHIPSLPHHCRLFFVVFCFFYSKRTYPCSKTLALIFLISLFYASFIYQSTRLSNQKSLFCIFIALLNPANCDDSLSISVYVGDCLVTCPVTVFKRDCPYDRSSLSVLLIVLSLSEAILFEKTVTTPSRTCLPRPSQQRKPCTKSGDGPHASCHVAYLLAF
jgi:hypothetical protein